MGTQKVELESVVHRGRGLTRRFFVELLLALRAGSIRSGRVEESPPGHRDQPALRIPRRVVRPDPDCLEQRILHGILGRREICSAADEDCEHARSEVPEQDVVHLMQVSP